jgi:phosphate transport system permease protein
MTAAPAAALAEPGGHQSELRLGASPRRRAVDTAARLTAWLAFIVALVPLVLVLGYTISRGAKRFDLRFFTHSMGGVAATDAGGGAYHAILGTVEQVGLTSLMAVPLGLAAAIYLTEYGRGWLRRAIRFFVDVMTGVPSIVAGLFIYVFWVLGLHQGFSGFAGSLALTILMLPVIIRSAEEMLLLVPSALREASYALGVPQWKTIMKIVLPTASAGLVTGIMLALARVVGETAPLILTVAGNNFINNNPFKGQQMGLPLFIYNQALQAYQPAIDRAWAGALALILIVVILYTAARLLTRRNQLTGRR